MSDDSPSFLEKCGVDTIKPWGLVHRKTIDYTINLLSSERETQLIKILVRRNIA
jgi:hypothetical protein